MPMMSLLKNWPPVKRPIRITWQDVILASKELKAELFGKKLERMGLHCPETSSSLQRARKTRSELLKPWML